MRQERKASQRDAKGQPEREGRPFVAAKDGKELDDQQAAADRKIDNQCSNAEPWHSEKEPQVQPVVQQRCAKQQDWQAAAERQPERAGGAR